MKISSGILAVISLALVGIWGIANAEPFTFEFSLPNWEANTDPSVFGTNGLLDVTVDNGASNLLSQTYLLSQIELIRLTAVGGTFSDTWLRDDVTNLQFSADSYFSTDASGTPILNLLASDDGSVIVFVNDTGTFQLGVIGPHGGWTTIYADVTPTGPLAYYRPSRDGTYTGFEETGILTTLIPVPEPSTCSLVILGLGGLLIVWLSRRRIR